MGLSRGRGGEGTRNAAGPLSGGPGCGPGGTVVGESYLGRERTGEGEPTDWGGLGGVSPLRWNPKQIVSPTL